MQTSGGERQPARRLGLEPWNAVERNGVGGAAAAAARGGGSAAGSGRVPVARRRLQHPGQRPAAGPPAPAPCAVVPLPRWPVWTCPRTLLSPPSCCPAVSVSPCPGLATAGSAACEHRWALYPNFCPPPGAAAAVSPHAHTHTHTHAPRGAEPRRGTHRPRLAAASPSLPGGRQGCRGGAARRAARRAGAGAGEGDGPLLRRPVCVSAHARRHSRVKRAPRAAPKPISRVPFACTACPTGSPTAEPRGQFAGLPLRLTWPGEAAAPCLLGAGIGGSPAAPSWRAGGGATAVGWALVPSVFSTAPPQGKKQVIPGSSIISYRRISHFLPLLNFFGYFLVSEQGSTTWSTLRLQERWLVSPPAALNPLSSAGAKARDCCSKGTQTTLGRPEPVKCASLPHGQGFANKINIYTKKKKKKILQPVRIKALRLQFSGQDESKWSMWEACQIKIIPDWIIIIQTTCLHP